MSWIAETFVQLLSPNFGATLSPFLTTPAGLAEFTTILWMVVRGARPAAQR